MVGFGSIGQGVLPLLFKHLTLSNNQITIISADDNGIDIARHYDVKFVKLPLTKENYKQELTPLLKKGDFLLNLSVEVSSVELIELAQSREVLYLDTCIEPWPGGYTDHEKPLYQRTNHALRQSAINLRARNYSSTAVICHGANPGLVSQFTKQALLNIARDNNISTTPSTQQEWAMLSRELNIKTIHIAERDTQVSNLPKSLTEFRNTWSVNGFLSEGLQPSELGFGTHEKFLPENAKYCHNDTNVIYLNKPGLSSKVRSWTPILGSYHGYLVTHNESISLSHFLRLTDNNKVVYSPTVHYSYHPCDETVFSIEQLRYKEYELPSSDNMIVLQDQIVDGVDELGVLLMGNEKGAYWYGSRLSNHDARNLCAYNTATSLQVTAGVLAGVMWAIENPYNGIVEAEQLDHAYIMNIASPYLGDVFGAYTDWTPLDNRNILYNEDLYFDDPWQFKNFIV